MADMVLNFYLDPDVKGGWLVKFSGIVGDPLKLSPPGGAGVTEFSTVRSFLNELGGLWCQESWGPNSLKTVDLFRRAKLANIVDSDGVGDMFHTWLRSSNTLQVRSRQVFAALSEDGEAASLLDVLADAGEAFVAALVLD